MNEPLSSETNIPQPSPVRGKCDSCGYKDTPGAQYGQYDLNLGRVPFYCDVCASTFLSYLHKDPKVLENPLYFYRALALGLNMVLDAIEELRSGKKR
jgi:predicted amidophosphoribosyltransferase